MTAAATQRLINAAKDVPEEYEDQVVSMVLSFTMKVQNPSERTTRISDGRYESPNGINAYEIQSNSDIDKPAKNEVRIGVAKGKFKAPDDFDMNNEEVYAMTRPSHGMPR